MRSRSASLRCLAMMGVFCLLALGRPGPGAPSAAAQETRASRSARPTVETVAGPGFCKDKTQEDRPAALVGSLAMDASGATFVQTGPPETGLIRRADQFGTAIVRGPQSSKNAGGSYLPHTGQIAPDGQGGLLVAAGARIVRLPSLEALGTPGAAGLGFAIEPVTGDASAPFGKPGAESTGDGGAAPAARLTRIAAIAADEKGNLFIAELFDEENRRFKIRFVNRTALPVVFYAGTADQTTVQPGFIDTIAGTGGAAGQGGGTARPDGPARSAALTTRQPALTIAGRVLYLTVQTPGNTSVVAVNLSAEPVAAHGITVAPGTLATVAGGGPAGYSGDGGPAVKARISNPSGLAADRGSLYIADRGNHRVRKVDSGGLITTFAGVGEAGFNGNYIPARRARLNRPVDIATGPNGSVYISDRGNRQLRVVDAEGIIRPAYGNGPSWKCTSANQQPSSGNLAAVTAGGGRTYLADRASGRVLARSTRPEVSTFLQAGGCPGCLKDPPQSLKATPGGLYVFDGTRILFANHLHKTVKANGVEVAAGTTRVVFTAKNGPPEDPSSVLRPGAPPLPMAFTADDRGNIFFADAAGIALLSDQGKTSRVTPRRRESCCLQATGMAADRAGNLYITDAAQSRVWLLNRSKNPVNRHGVTVNPGKIRAVAGNGAEGPGGEAVPATQTSLDAPTGPAADINGNLYFSETRAHVVRKLDPAGIITTVAGTGQAGFNGDGLAPRFTALSSPTGLALEGCSNLLITDAGNDRIRRLALQEACPAERPSPPKESNRLPVAGIVAFTVLAGAAGFAVARRRGRQV